MFSIQQIQHVAPDQQAGVVAMGNFDGVHCGHQYLLQHSQYIAQSQCLPLTVLILTLNSRKSILTAEHTKLALIQKIVPNAHIVCHDLTIDYQLYGPQKFLQQVIGPYLKPRSIVVGDNFRFGYQCTGDVKTLQQLSSQYNYQLHIIKTSVHPVSSTLARTYVRTGKITELTKILGRYWWIDCQVIPGVQEHNTYPSANIHIQEYVSPACGIYLAYTKIIQNIKSSPWYPALAYFGKAPTTLNRPQNILEVHLLRQKLNLYYLKLRVMFINLLRPDKKFTSKEMLNSQIKSDILRAETEIKKLNIDWCKYE